MKIRTILASVCTVVLLGGLLSGCHTVHGAGQDISEGGQAISSAATSVHNGN